MRLPEGIARLIAFRRPISHAKEPDLCCLAPAAENGQLAATVEQMRRCELRFDAFVAGNAVAAAQVDEGVGADGTLIAGAEREAASGVRARKERIPGDSLIDEDVLGFIDQPFSLAWAEREQARTLIRLRLLDERLASRSLGLLCSDGSRRSCER